MSDDNARTPANLSSHWTPLFDELRWVIQIRHTLDEELEEDDGIRVSIFNVPKPLVQNHSDSFLPQLIAVGPYHHWRPQLYEMEKYKLSAAKRVLKQLRDVKINQVVDGIAKHEKRIRANYHRNLDFNDETLAWMMAVDACFLLEYLQVYAVHGEVKSLGRVSSRMSHLMDSSGRKAGHNIILKDIMMLENQIPLFILRKIMDFQYPSRAQGDDVMDKILTGFMREVCPLKMENFPVIDVSQHPHLLALLYYVVVHKVIESQGNDNHEIQEEPSEDPAMAMANVEEEFQTQANNFQQRCGKIWGTVNSALNGAPVRYVKKVVSAPLKFLVKIPWSLLTIIPGFSVLKQPVKLLFPSAGKDEDSRDEKENSDHANKPPRVEEIMIPSVEDLQSAGIRFLPTKGHITTISFDSKTATFYLPTVILDVKTEVVLRNLVAYETSVATGPLVFTRYTELMSGIIDTEEDVMILRNRGVVVNQMKSDKEVADLWNEMSRSLRLTRVEFLDKVIEDVNKYHNSRWRVKTKKVMTKYVFASWPILTFLAAILLLLLTGMQSFCSVYTCSRWFDLPTVAVSQHP